jgi:hypothetical protein
VDPFLLHPGPESGEEHGYAGVWPQRLKLHRVLCLASPLLSCPQTSCLTDSRTNMWAALSMVFTWPENSCQMWNLKLGK